jgi:LysM repeat protein
VKEEPSSGSPGRRASWPAALETVAIVVVAVITVLGAVVLATQSEALHEQSVSYGPHTPTVDWIPTASAATLAPLTLIPRILTANTPQSVPQQDPTASVETLPGTHDRDAGQEDAPTSTSSKPSLTPTMSPTKTPAATNTPWPCAPSTPLGWQLYIVQNGDTLYSLAVGHGTSIYEVVKYNCLTTYQLWTGQRLYLPPSPTATGEIPTATTQPTSTATPTAPPAATATQTPGAILLPTSTPTTTLTPSGTAIATPEPTASGTPNAEPTVTASTELTPDITEVPSDTPAPSATPTPLPTETPEPSPTAEGS